MALLGKGNNLEAAENAARCILTVTRGSANLKGSCAKTIKNGMPVVLAAVRKLEARAFDPTGGEKMESLRQEIGIAGIRFRRLERELVILKESKKKVLRTGRNAICGHRNGRGY